MASQDSILLVLLGVAMVALAVGLLVQVYLSNKGMRSVLEMHARIHEQYQHEIRTYNLFILSRTAEEYSEVVDNLRSGDLRAQALRNAKRTRRAPVLPLPPSLEAESAIDEALSNVPG